MKYTQVAASNTKQLHSHTHDTHPMKADTTFFLTSLHIRRLVDGRELLLNIDSSTAGSNFDV